MAPALGVAFTLAPGETATLEDDSLSVTFTAVTSDSRCPTKSGVVCVWEGDALVRLAVVAGPPGPGSEPTAVELHTSSRNATAAAAGRYTVRLVGLEPEASTEPVAQADYRAALLVEVG